MSTENISTAEKVDYWLIRSLITLSIIVFAATFINSFFFIDNSLLLSLFKAAAYVSVTWALLFFTIMPLFDWYAIKKRPKWLYEEVKGIDDSENLK